MVDSKCSNGVQHQGSAKTDSQLFEEQFEELVSELTRKKTSPTPVLADALNRLTEVLRYNAPGGKRNRGPVCHWLTAGVSPPPRSCHMMLFAHALLWLAGAIELLQAFFLVADDIMDASVTRRGQPCWYNKGSWRRHCRGQAYYTHLLELFTETSFQTELGQALDLMTAPPNQIDLNRFTVERYKAIVKYKTAFYSFYLPVASAMYMAGIDSELEHNNAKTILLEMGEFFQIQDDYLDCYGDPAVTGKIGTRHPGQQVAAGWLVTALGVMTPEQREQLQSCYGAHDDESVECVKALYGVLGIARSLSAARRGELPTPAQAHRVSRPKILPHAVFLNFAKKIYKRNK
ncbi:hypothetical protein SKAU_G00224000 [Synaphobranchus kaupii]|uniref:Farnesyl pyrophosphate synthase n=1 Tax=Synaphobranchus kaupii TaxID=118154 RepID=A0A9Q1FB97_SYNKA|nr:hypothetical protein SKAU_G00224000 [Synaphobranchus kaupii]